MERLHNVQPSTRFGTVSAPKHSGRGLAVSPVTPRPGQQPQFLVTFLRAFRLVLCFVFLFGSSLQGGLSLLLGGNWGREGASLPSPQLCLHFPVGEIWGPIFPRPLCVPPSNTCYLRSLGASQGRVRMDCGGGGRGRVVGGGWCHHLKGTQVGREERTVQKPY